MKIAEVILPLPLRSNFDYRIPEELEPYAAPGIRVLVTFGKSKIHTGVIKTVRATAQLAEWRQLKPIHELLDNEEVMVSTQFRLMEWIAFYYFCSEGEVLQAALPAGLKLESEWVITKGPMEPLHELALPDKEFQLLDLLRVRTQMTADEAAKLWQLHNPLPRLRGMESRGYVKLSQQVAEKYAVKTEPWMELAAEWRDEQKLHQAFDLLRRAPKQEEALMLIVAEFLKSGQPLRKQELNHALKGAGPALQSLEDKGLIRQLDVPVDRVPGHDFRQHRQDLVLTSEQERALAEVKGSLETSPGKPVLLHGITGSGKTLLYIQLIREALERGEQALYLLPEIAITQQIIDKVKSAFGDTVGVYHSRFSDHERVEIWRKVLRGQYQVVVGVRSSIFLPFTRLGLVVVDEEHDHSFKQAEPNPKYNARDLAVWLASSASMRVVLGTATPSMETYYNAVQGRYTLVELHSRAIEAQLPEIIRVDMKDQRRRKVLDGSFSHPLRLAVQATMEAREQAILFQNRRGFAPFLVCSNCGYVPRCTQCDISLTYHKGRNHLRCHYCGHTEFDVSKCPVCHAHDYKQPGMGTERIEEESRVHWPKARIARMDLDTTRTRNAFQSLIRGIENHEIDLLVGTQMVSKGLDFGNVTLVGVMDADTLLHFSDFRAHEHTYQLLTQVSGRAGRGEKKGRVIIQSYNPEDPVLLLLQRDFRLFYQHELQYRQQLHYPPFTRLIQLELRHAEQVFLEQEAASFRKLLSDMFGSSFLGPEYPPVNRIRGQYRMTALLKLARNANPHKVRESLQRVIDAYYAAAPQKTLRIVVDVDPL